MNTATKDDLSLPTQPPIAADGSRVASLDELMPPPVSWVRRAADIFVLSLGLPALGLVIVPQDPLMLGTGSPWLLALAPIMIGILHGSMAAVISAMISQAILTYLLHGASLPPLEDPLWRHGAALLTMALICGELAARWQRRMRRMRILCHANEQREAGFLRHYHSLRLSHDQLLEQLAAQPFTLRESLSQLRALLQHPPVNADHKDNSPLAQHHGSEILGFFARHSRIQRAALLSVDEHGRIMPDASWLGTATHLELGSVMFRQALKTGRVISLADLLDAAPETPVCVIPLIDISGHIHALLTVLDLPFIDFHHGQLQRLAVIAANVGDLLTEPQHGTDQPFPHLKRWVQHARRDAIPSAVIRIELTPEQAPAVGQQVQQLLEHQRRGLDLVFHRPVADGGQSSIVLLPLTDAEGTSAWRARLVPQLEALLEPSEPLEGLSTGMKIHQRLIDSDTRLTQLLSDLGLRDKSHAAH